MGIKLRKKTLKNGNISLYLDIYFRGQKRKYEFLGIYYNPKNIHDKKQKIYIAEEIRLKKEIDILSKNNGIVKVPKLSASNKQIGEDSMNHKIIKNFNKKEFQELVKVYMNNDLKVNTIDARSLWEYIGSKKQFADWIKDKIKYYGYVDGIDFLTFRKKMNRQNKAGASVLKEYHISLDMAKECAMTENNSIGREVRKYFIQIEKEYKQIRNNIPDDRQTDEWNQIRLEGKWTRKNLTDIIKDFIEYAKDQGANDGCKWYYKNITAAINKSLFLIESCKKIKKNLRDNISIGQLSHIQTLEDMIANDIIKKVKQGLDYKSIYKDIVNICLYFGDKLGYEKPMYITNKEYLSLLSIKDKQIYKKDQKLLY